MREREHKVARLQMSMNLSLGASALHAKIKMGFSVCILTFLDSWTSPTNSLSPLVSPCTWCSCLDIFVPHSPCTIRLNGLCNSEWVPISNTPMAIRPMVVKYVRLANTRFLCWSHSCWFVATYTCTRTSTTLCCNDCRTVRWPSRVSVLC